jgi:hypothetical protein
MSTKPPKIRISLGFRRMQDAALLARSIAVQSGMTGNGNFPAPPVDLATLKTANDNFSAAISASLDGGRKVVTEKNKHREALIKMLRQLATYVEANFKEELAILTTSGFEAAPLRSALQTLSPGIRTIDQGNSGQLQVRLAGMTGAKTYELRYAPITNGVPGAWITLPIASIKKMLTISSLTPGTMYAFQVRSFSNNGYSDWTDSVTKMST